MDVKAILERSQQRAVQFACTMSQKPKLSRSEKDALEKFLTEANPELFQNVETRLQEGEKKPLFLVSRQYSVGSLLATAPSLVILPTAVTITQVLSLGSVKTGGDGTLQNTVLNKKMREILFKIHDLIKGARFTRAGKIFEFNLGPFNPEEKKDLLKSIIPNTEDIIHFKSGITRLVKKSEDLNVSTTFQFLQTDLNQPFLLQVKVDINNRNHKNHMDPKEIDQIFSDADSIIIEHLEWIFGGAS